VSADAVSYALLRCRYALVLGAGVVNAAVYLVMHSAAAPQDARDSLRQLRPALELLAAAARQCGVAIKVGGR
jgi:hypothetical protein